MIRRYERDETVFKHNKTILHPYSGTVKEKANNYFELEAEIPMNEIANNGDVIVAPTPRGEQPFRVYRHIKTLKGKKVFARHLSYDLVNNFLIDVRASNALVQDALQQILNNTESPHLFTSSSNMINRATAYYIRKNPIEAIMGAENSVLNRWGGFLVRDNYNLRIINSGADRNFEIRLGKNLIGIEDNSDESQIITRLYPTIVINQVVHALPEKFVDSPLLNAYESPKISEVRIALDEDEEQLPLEELHQVMRDYCNNLYTVDNIDKPISNYIVDFVQLKNTSALSGGYLDLMEQIDLYDCTTVKVAELDIDVKLQMIEYSYNILTEKYNDIQIGQNPAASSYQTSNIIKHITNELAKVNTDFAELWDTSINKVTGNKGGHKITRLNANKKPYETLYMDTEDINTALEILRINKSGIAGTTNGINGPYDLAITTDGWVVGKRILTESLSAITANLGTITAGRIQDADNESYWDLNSKEIVLNVKSLKINAVDAATKEELDAIELTPGPAGISITKVEVEYYMSTSATEMLDGSWSITPPTWVDGSFMWSRIKTTYSNNTETDSNPAVITGAQGNIGPNGRGVESISSQYYLSTSKTSRLGGSWADTPQPWVAGKFMWTRSKVIYTSPTQTYYTDPVVDTAWEKINGISSSVESLEQVTTPNAIVNTFISEFGTDDEKAIMKGIIKLWKYGINVGNSLSEINSNMLNNGFDVRDGDTLITNMGETGAVVPTLYNEVLVNPNVLQYAPRGVYTVGPSGTFLTLQEAIDWIFRDGKRFLNEQILLEVYGNQNGNILIKEVYGGSIIIRLMDGAKVYGSFNGQDLYTSLVVESGGVGKGFVSVGEWAFNFNRCYFVMLEGINIRGNAVNVFARASNVILRDVDVGSNNTYYGYIAEAGARIMAINCRGRVTGLRAQTRNGVIHQVGGMITHALGDGDDNTNGPIYNTNTSLASSLYQAPVITTQTFERYFKVATLDTLSNGGSVSSYYGPTAAQNRWTGMSTWSLGRIRMGREIKDFIAGGTGIQIQIRLRRSNTSHGSRSPIPPTPSNFSAAMGGAEQGEWTSWANISSSYFGDSVDLQLGGNITSNYAIWDAVEVWAQVTKQI